MKLKTYNQLNTNPAPKSGPPFIFINSRRGVVALSVDLQNEMGLKLGDKIALSQDEENPHDWYIHRDENGIPLSKPYNRAKQHSIRSVKIARELLKSIGFKEEATRMLVSTEPVHVSNFKLWPIITKSAKQSA